MHSLSRIAESASGAVAAAGLAAMFVDARLGGVALAAALALLCIGPAVGLWRAKRRA